MNLKLIHLNEELNYENITLIDATEKILDFLDNIVDLFAPVSEKVLSEILFEHGIYHNLLYIDRGSVFFNYDFQISINELFIIKKIWKTKFQDKTFDFVIF